MIVKNLMVDMATSSIEVLIFISGAAKGGVCS